MLVQAANYLNIKSLLDLTCQTVANMIKGAAALPAPCHRSLAFVMTGAISMVVLSQRLCVAAGKTPEEIRKTFNIPVSCEIMVCA